MSGSRADGAAVGFARVAGGSGSAWTGVGLALLVIGAWLAVEVAGLFLLPLHLAVLLAPLATFLYVGLFITAHDALHGTVAPGRPRLNRALGRLALFLYAGFGERALAAAHARHHATPAADGDPDWSRGERFLPWLAGFTWHYLSLAQLAGLAIVGNVLIHACGVRPAQLLAVWVAPALASALQLFTFGTWLPHRTPAGGHADRHRARSLQLSAFWSFLTCWHFGGRHHQHHADPSLPWWRLGATGSGRTTNVARGSPAPAGAACPRR